MTLDLYIDLPRYELNKTFDCIRHGMAQNTYHVAIPPGVYTKATGKLLHT